MDRDSRAYTRIDKADREALPTAIRKDEAFYNMVRIMRLQVKVEAHIPPQSVFLAAPSSIRKSRTTRMSLSVTSVPAEQSDSLQLFLFLWKQISQPFIDYRHSLFHCLLDRGGCGGFFVVNLPVRV